MSATPPERKQGFAAMDPARQRAIARQGGKAAAEKGAGVLFTSETGAKAGAKGGGRMHKAYRARRGPP